MWALVFWRNFSPDSAPRIEQLMVLLLLFLTTSINPLIYTLTNGEFRREFRKLMSCCKAASIAPEEAIAVSENKKVDNEVKNAEMKQKV